METRTFEYRVVYLDDDDYVKENEIIKVTEQELPEDADYPEGVESRAWEKADKVADTWSDVNDYAAYELTLVNSY